MKVSHAGREQMLELGWLGQLVGMGLEAPLELGQVELLARWFWDLGSRRENILPFCLNKAGAMWPCNHTRSQYWPPCLKSRYKVGCRWLSVAWAPLWQKLHSTCQSLWQKPSPLATPQTCYISNKDCCIRHMCRRWLSAKTTLIRTSQTCRK